MNAAIPADVNTRTAEILALPLPDVWQLATPNERARVGAPQVAGMNPARRARLAPVIRPHLLRALPIESADIHHVPAGCAM